MNVFPRLSDHCAILPTAAGKAFSLCASSWYYVLYSVALRRKVGEPVLCHHLLLLFFNKGNGFQDERDKSPIKDPKVVVTLSRANIVEEIILICETAVSSSKCSQIKSPVY